MMSPRSRGAMMVAHVTTVVLQGNKAEPEDAQVDVGGRLPRPRRGAAAQDLLQGHGLEDAPDVK